MSTIFISIASYNDPSLAKTIRSALNAADNPGGLSFGLGLQYYEDPDLSEFDNLKIISYDPDTRPGIIKIRHNISKLYEDQDYYLQIDSHYKFSQSWDTELLESYEKISREADVSKLILFPLEVYPDGIMTSYFVPTLEHREIGPVLHPLPVNGKSQEYEDYHEIFFGRVGQIFLPGSYIKDVGLDEYSHTSMEIAYFSYRAIMSGYRFFQLNKALMWQDDKEYFDAVWDGKKPEEVLESETRFKSAAVSDHPATWYELSLAYIYNDYSKYAIKNPAMRPEDYWNLQGQLEEFLEIRDMYDSVITNDYFLSS
jgi:hypothetical protein